MKDHSWILSLIFFIKFYIIHTLSFYGINAFYLGVNEKAQVQSFIYTRYMHVRCHEAGERVERRLDYKYNYCLLLNTKVHVVYWLA
jgi:hypothetical protein